MTEENSFQNTFGQKPPTPPARQLLILFGLVCAGYLLAGICTLVMVSVTPGASVSTILNEGGKFTELLKWIQVAGTLCMFALPALAFGLIVKPHRDYFYTRTKTPATIWLLVILIALAAIPATDLFTRLNEWIPLSKGLTDTFRHMEDEYEKQMLLMLNFSGFGQYMASMILIALLPALFEELLFRGALQQILISWFKRPFWGILAASVIFSAIHGSYYGFLPRIFLGMMMGYVFYLGKNIWLNISIHFINNGMVLTLLYFAPGHQLTDETMNATSPLYLQITGAIVLIILFYFFVQQVKIHNTKTESGTS